MRAEQLYAVERTPEGVKLWRVNGPRREEISPKASLLVRRHSPDGFEFGYSGSGPSQLALAILLDAFAAAPDPELAALDHYIDFREAFIASEAWEIDGEIRKQRFEISKRQILRFLSEQIMRRPLCIHPFQSSPAS